jgi:GAF domain-containing protein
MGTPPDDPDRAYPVPGNEADRLDALHRLLCLDTPPEARFDAIVQFAADEFDVPIVLISLVDAHRQWFKSKIGVDLCETARGISFCTHAIMSPEAMVIPDAKADPRFRDNPMVLGEPFVRFYAGAPLELAGGLRVGTLCLIDTRPRGIDPLDLAILNTLRDLIVRELVSHANTPPAAQ